MARPRTFKIDDIAEKLMNIFWRKGYARTSIPDLTEASGLLRGSLYAAFGNKDAMFKLALDRYLKELRSDIVSETPGINGIRYMLNQVVHLTVSDPERRGCLLINAIPEASSLPDVNRAAISEGLEEMKQFIHFKLLEEQKTSKISPDLDRLMALIFASSVSIRVLGRAGQDKQLLQNVADGAVDALRHSFAHKKS